MKWKSVRLGEITRAFISGGTPDTKTSEFWTGRIPWITGADVVDGKVNLGRRFISESAVQNSAANIVPKGSVLLVTRTGVGKIAIAQDDIAISQDLTGIVVKAGFVPTFVMWAILGQIGSLISVQRGATIKGVLRTDVAHLPIPFTGISEQRRIVELLEQADGLRRQRAEADAIAERILPALFLKMFGDPTTNPKGWPTTTLDHATRITTGNTPSREDPENFGGGIPWGRPADLETALPLLHTAENISQKGARIARVVPAGSVLVCCIGATLGKVGLAGVEMAINQQINALLPSAKATPEFLYTFCLLNARNFMAAATQATLPILNKSRFGQQPVFLPPIERQARFSELTQAVIKQRPAQSEARLNLENIFATMLHRAFTGELTAKWREAHLKELLAEMEQQAGLLKPPLEE